MKELSKFADGDISPVFVSGPFRNYRLLFLSFVSVAFLKFIISEKFSELSVKCLAINGFMTTHITVPVFINSFLKFTILCCMIGFQTVSASFIGYW